MIDTHKQFHIQVKSDNFSYVIESADTQEEADLLKDFYKPMYDSVKVIEKNNGKV